MNKTKYGFFQHICQLLGEINHGLKAQELQSAKALLSLDLGKYTVAELVRIPIGIEQVRHVFQIENTIKEATLQVTQMSWIPIVLSSVESGGMTVLRGPATSVKLSAERGWQVRVTLHRLD